MNMDGLYPAVFSHPANFASIGWFKAGVFISPALMPAVRRKDFMMAIDIKWVLPPWFQIQSRDKIIR